MLKKRPRYVEVEGCEGGTKRSRILIVVIVIAIFVLAFGSFGGDKEKKQGNVATENQGSVAIDEYVSQNEQRLAEILTAVQGAGRVKVMITVSEMSEKVVATDKKNINKQETEKESTTRDLTQESTTVIYGSGSEEKPFIIKEKLPAISGVVVAATGAGDEGVRLELYEAVKALYGISGHRIKITKGNIKN